MPRRRMAPLAFDAVSRWRLAVTRAASLCMTIRGRILIAFLVMSVITAALGAYASMGIRNAGVLVDKTFDESLMSINYARAAAADFAAMRAAFARQWIAADPQMRSALDKELDKLSTVAVGRSQDRGRTLAVGARHARRRKCSKRGQRLEEDIASACSTAARATSIGRRSTATPTRSTIRSISW